MKNLMAKIKRVRELKQYKKGLAVKRQALNAKYGMEVYDMDNEVHFASR